MRLLGLNHLCVKMLLHPSHPMNFHANSSCPMRPLASTAAIMMFLCLSHLAKLHAYSPHPAPLPCFCYPMILHTCWPHPVMFFHPSHPGKLYANSPHPARVLSFSHSNAALPQPPHEAPCSRPPPQGGSPASVVPQHHALRARLVLWLFWPTAPSS